jgi:ribosomal protein L7Ae-like RNA K-turn-binding protein
LVIDAREGSDEPARRAAGRRVLDLLGLAARAGGILTGIDSVRRAAREDHVFRVILAQDAAPGQQGKLTPLLEARQVPFHTLFTRNELGAATGRGPVSAIGFTDRNFARRAGELVGTLTEGRFTAQP